MNITQWKDYLLTKGLESVLPLMASHTPDTLTALIEKVRDYGVGRIRKNHRGTAEERERRVEAANAFFNMAKQQFPRLSKATQKKLATNVYLNTVLLGDRKRDEYFKLHGEFPPFLLLISPSMACDLRCFGCYAWKHPKEKQLSLEKVNAIIDEARTDMGLHFIAVTGGEPTFWPHLEELFKSQPEVFFLVYTHGMNIDEERAKRWSELGNVYPAISVEGSEEFTDRRRGKGAFQKILAAMDLLKKYGVLFGVSITHTRENHLSVISDQFYDLLADHGVAFGWIFQYLPIGREAEKDLLPTGEQRLERREIVHRIRATRPILLYDFFNDGDACEGCIAWGRKYVHITAQGLVEPCVFVHFATDSIHDKSLGEIIRSPCFKDARSRQPFTTDLRRPCPQIDHPDELVRLVKTYNMQPTHEGAEQIITDHHDMICQMAADYQAVLTQADTPQATQRGEVNTPTTNCQDCPADCSLTPAE